MMIIDTNDDRKGEGYKKEKSIQNDRLCNRVEKQIKKKKQKKKNKKEPTP